MALSTAERRFLRGWEEQRKGGKWAYIGTYTFGLTFLIFLCSIALGLFMNLPFIEPFWISIMAVVAFAGAIILSFIMWDQGQKKFRRIINRETASNN